VCTAVFCVWATIRAYRRKILVALDVDFKEEVEWVNRIAAENPKNYQIWYCTRITALRPVSLSLSHRRVLGLDAATLCARRYHRKALVERSRDPSLELDFIVQMLKGILPLGLLLIVSVAAKRWLTRAAAAAGGLPQRTPRTTTRGRIGSGC
jgi:hypothetical protein